MMGRAGTSSAAAAAVATEHWRGRAYASIRNRRWAEAERAIAAWLRAAPGDVDARECRAEIAGLTGDRERAAIAMAHLGFGQLDAGHVQRAWQLLERGRAWAEEIDELSVLADELAQAGRPASCDVGSTPQDCPSPVVVDCIDRAEPVGGCAVNDDVRSAVPRLVGSP